MQIILWLLHQYDTLSSSTIFVYEHISAILFIVTNSGEPIEKQSILDFLASKVAKWWLPDEIVFLKDLPHGATGKLQKFELRDEYANFYMEK